MQEQIFIIYGTFFVFCKILFSVHEIFSKKVNYFTEVSRFFPQYWKTIL